jgi:hypothetical protein
VPRAGRDVRRSVLIAVAALLTVAAILGVLVFFSARDESTIGDEETSAPGEPAASLTDEALRRGNVVLRFSTPADRDVLRALADEFGPETLADQGQAVLVRRDTTAQGVVAQAYRRQLRVRAADDPALREFVEYWLGRGEMR